MWPSLACLLGWDTQHYLHTTDCCVTTQNMEKKEMFRYLDIYTSHMEDHFPLTDCLLPLLLPMLITD